jgi:hypothetical protein
MPRLCFTTLPYMSRATDGSVVKDADFLRAFGIIRRLW